MNLNTLRDEAFKIACEHGFHDTELSNEHYLMLVITELSEAVEADRKDRHADIAKFKEWQGNSLSLSEETRIKRFKEDFEAYIKDTVEDELADAYIRLLDLAGLWDINIGRIEFVNVMSSKRTFTENIYVITECLTNDEYLLEEQVNKAITQLLGLTDILGIDLEWHIRIKMKYNSMRENKHGKKY